jgi:proteasome lid subunit RPN8/RPN11
MPTPEISVPADALAAMAKHGYDCFPEEMCGLLVGNPATNEVVRFVPTTNIAHSAKVYTIDPKEHLRAELAAETDGFDIIGCAHSHTHTEAYPSPTDVAQAPDPDWHYIIVSLMREAPEARSYLIAGETITEEIISPV